jgi:hypothetical protein
MKQLLFKKLGRLGPIPSLAAFSKQIRRGVTMLRALLRTLTKALRLPSVQYRIALLLAAVVVSLLDWSMLQLFISSTSIITMKIEHKVRALKSLPHTLTKALLLPSIQYRIALLLTALIVLLSVWITLLSTLSHTGTIAFIERF